MKNKKDEMKDPPTGKDEMNLAEYPITLLAYRNTSNIKTIEISDTITGENGRPVKREWIVTGSDKFGLPLAQDNDVLLALLAIGKEQGFIEPKIYFSSFRLLNILKWGTDGRAYRRMEEALDRLCGVRVKADHAFYDNVKKGYHTVNFGILDSYDLFDSPGRKKHNQEGLPFSYVVLNSKFFQSIKTGYIKSLDLKTYFKIEGSVTKRLFRYLEKKRYDGKRLFGINLFTLAYTHIGFEKATYKYASNIKQKLDPAHSELIQVGFLKSAEYQRTSDGASEKVIYVFTEKMTQKALPEPQEIKISKKQQETEIGLDEGHRGTIEAYLKELTPDKLAELRKEAEARARQEGVNLYRDREIPEQVIRGYMSELASKTVKV